MFYSGQCLFCNALDDGIAQFELGVGCDVLNNKLIEGGGGDLGGGGWQMQIANYVAQEC